MIPQTMIRRVKTENGWVRGLPAADPRCTSYKGIPFAAKPVGENRWRAPQPCPDWEGELFAAEFAPIPMQWGSASDPEKDIYAREWAVDPTVPMSEDCLYLNIWAPADGRQNMPVYVWYFGGGLQCGHTAEMEFDGERLARRGVVVVTIAYRLNVFGFLCHPDITAEAPDAPANFGFLDQQFGTRWVKRNIAAFGGDPENITIGGQSAGGMSVCAQMTHPANEGLFQRAIVQSGTFIQPYTGRMGLHPRNLAQAEEQGKKFFDALGVKSLAEARAIDARTIENLSLSMPWGWWGETIDGKFSTYGSNAWFLHEDRVKCSVLLGQTSSEFAMSPPARNDEELIAFANESFGEDAEAFLRHFSRPATEESIAREGRVPSISMAIRTAAACNAAKGIDQPLYAYNFDAEIPGWDNPGTFHSVDLWFFFETLAKCWRPFTGKHYDLARQMCDYWANFIKSGDPNGIDSQGRELPAWPKANLENPEWMVFADTAKAESWPEAPLDAMLREAYLKREG